MIAALYISLWNMPYRLIESSNRQIKKELITHKINLTEHEIRSFSTFNE